MQNFKQSFQKKLDGESKRKPVRFSNQLASKSKGGEPLHVWFLILFEPTPDDRKKNVRTMETMIKYYLQKKNFLEINTMTGYAGTEYGEIAMCHPNELSKMIKKLIQFPNDASFRGYKKNRINWAN